VLVFRYRFVLPCQLADLHSLVLAHLVVVLLADALVLRWILAALALAFVAGAGVGVVGVAISAAGFIAALAAARSGPRFGPPWFLLLDGYENLSLS
jgi:hypothetical protein